MTVIQQKFHIDTPSATWIQHSLSLFRSEGLSSENAGERSVVDLGEVTWRSRAPCHLLLFFHGLEGYLATETRISFRWRWSRSSSPPPSSPELSLLLPSPPTPSPTPASARTTSADSAPLSTNPPTLSLTLTSPVTYNKTLSSSVTFFLSSSKAFVLNDLAKGSVLRLMSVA